MAGMIPGYNNSSLFGGGAGSAIGGSGGSFFGSHPMMPASGGGIGGGGMVAPQAPVQNWQSSANPVQAYQQYENDYANYVNQNAAYQNALRGQPQSQGPQGLGGGGSNPQVQAYMQYLSQALPSINNGIRSGAIQPGQTLQNFQGPQSFGIPNSGFGGMMGGGQGGFDMNAIMQLLQRMGGGQGGGNIGSIFNGGGGGGGWMNSISQMVSPPMMGGWSW